MAGSPKCTYCGKSVFHAEEQQFDGKIFHIQCMGKYVKESRAEDLRPRNVMYEATPDVSPACINKNISTPCYIPKLQKKKKKKKKTPPSHYDGIFFFFFFDGL